MHVTRNFLLFRHWVMSYYFATSWTGACQTPLSMRFPRQEYWSGLPFHSSGDLPNLGIKAGFSGGLYLWASREANWTFRFSSVQSLSRVWLFATLLIAARQASLLNWTFNLGQLFFKYVSTIWSFCTIPFSFIYLFFLNLQIWPIVLFTAKRELSIFFYVSLVYTLGLTNMTYNLT